MEIKKSNIQTYLAAFLIFFAVAAPFATSQCNTNSSNYVDLTLLPNYSGDINLCSYAGRVQDPDSAQDFFWYFPAVNQLIDPPLLIFLNNIGESSLSALFLEQGPLQFTSLNGQNISILNRASSWSNFMNVLYIDTGYTGGFVQTPGISNPQTSVYANYFFQTLNLVFQKLNLNPQTIGPISLYARGLSAQVAIQAKYIAFNSKQQIQITSLILDNPFLDQTLQQSALLQGALGLGLFSTEQSNIAEAFLQGCVYNSVDLETQTYCLKPSVYFEKETYLNSKDVRENLQTANSFNSRRTYLQNYLTDNIQNLTHLLNYDINQVQLINQQAFTTYQTFYAQYATTLDQLQTLLLNHQSIAVLAGEFNLQASVSGLTQIISRTLGFKSYAQFPLKQNYYADKMANQVTGQQFGYYYSWGSSNTFNFIVSQSGAYIDDIRWLNATSELVYNLASGQNYLCPISKQTCQVSTKIKQDAMKNCNGNGVFNQQTAVCVCEIGFALADCSGQSTQIQTENQYNFILKPRQWQFYWIKGQNPDLGNYFLEIKKNSTEIINVELSYSGFSAGTFQDFAGITSNIQASGKGYTNKIQIPFPESQMTYISIQNPSFQQDISYNLQATSLTGKGKFYPPSQSTWQSANAGYVASIVMLSLGGALIVAAFFVWFLGIKPLSKKREHIDEIVLTTQI